MLKITIIYNLNAPLFTAVTGRTSIFLMFQKHLLLAENECTFSIIQFVLFLGTLNIFLKGSL